MRDAGLAGTPVFAVSASPGDFDEEEDEESEAGDEDDEDDDGEDAMGVEIGRGGSSRRWRRGRVFADVEAWV